MKYNHGGGVAHSHARGVTQASTRKAPLRGEPKTLLTLRGGCYLMSFKPSAQLTPDGPGTYVGTLRVEEPASPEDQSKVSGDLYYFSDRSGPSADGSIIRIDPKTGRASLAGAGDRPIPVFSSQAYRYYV